MAKINFDQMDADFAASQVDRYHENIKEPKYLEWIKANNLENTFESFSKYDTQNLDSLEFETIDARNRGK